MFDFDLEAETKNPLPFGSGVLLSSLLYSLTRSHGRRPEGQANKQRHKKDEHSRRYERRGRAEGFKQLYHMHSPPVAGPAAATPPPDPTTGLTPQCSSAQA
jgi:hypothetical protein